MNPKGPGIFAGACCLQLGFPGIDHRNSCRSERDFVPGGDRIAVHFGDCSDLSIGKTNRYALLSAIRKDGRVSQCRAHIKRENSRTEEALKRSRQQLAHLVSTTPHWHDLDAGKKFGNSDAGYVQDIKVLRIDPVENSLRWPRLHGFRDDVGVKDNHSKTAGSTGV